MDEVDATASAGLGKCCICGKHRKLTFEHIPPKRAFNSGGGRSTTIDQLLAEYEGNNARYSKDRKGFGKLSLCELCNNNTGAWYGNAYVEWAHQGMRFLDASGTLAMPFHIFPGRVAKQIIAMFASTNGPNFFDAHPELRKFVLDPQWVGIPKKFKLLTYLTTSNVQTARITGIIATMDFGQSKASIFSEIAFTPFGYILVIDSPPPARGLFDITFFCHEPYRQYRDLHLPIGAKEVHSYIPADFRTEEEWSQAQALAKEERAAAKLRRDAF
ncbi:HNH endonuclease [Rhizobium pusense]|uniref:hypothetical protein n=1 Tax=Agrobacterium pusense TaxID=648995 RepID=UPI00244AB98A|nr:hypothetical protein [Agrobacterium pusense]MDH1270120.1 HNH endonuclease [Agrobacterium pusense]